jgi:hypothetical protein
MDPNTYRLDLPFKWRQHPVFHESLLTPYHPPLFSNQEQPHPPPELDEEGHPVYEIASILDAKPQGRGWKYLIHWKGYAHSEDTWEPGSSLTGASDILKEFRLSHPSLFSRRKS